MKRVSREVKVAKLYGFEVGSLQSGPSALLDLAKEVYGPLGLQDREAAMTAYKASVVQKY